MPENVTEQKTSQESSHEGLSGHPLDLSAEAAPARQLTRPGDSSPAMPAHGRRSMAPPALDLHGVAPGGLPMQLKHGIESLAGVSMDGVRVVHGSSEPARYGAGAFARKGEIHLGPGQGDKLDHEAWHIAQQRRGKVRATRILEGQPFNDDPGLEAEADRMGALARNYTAQGPAQGGAVQQGSDVNVMQFAPGDFAGHAVLREPAKTGPFRTSHWEPLCNAVTEYSQTDPANLKKRLTLLREIGVFYDRWKVAHGLPGKEQNLSQANRNKLTALNVLRASLNQEYFELGSSNGALVVANPGLGNTSPEPELTKVREEKDKRMRGYFLAGAAIVNAQNANVANPATGVLSRVTKTEVGPAGQQAQLYYAVRPAPDEDAAFGTVAAFPSGFVLRSHVNAVNLDQSATSTLQYEDRFNPDIHPLFPAPPSVVDVEQSGLGDCYLMAAILTLVRHHPNHFTNHMVDHGDGVVSVKLYEHAGGIFTPKTVHIRKSVVVKKSAKTTLEEGYNKGAIWVQLLEKAYIAAGFSGNKLETLPTNKMQWSQAASGNSAVALGHLTGRTATDTAIQSVESTRTRGRNNWADPRSRDLDNHLLANSPVDYGNYINLDRNNTVLIQRLADLTKSKDEVRLDDVEQMVRATPHVTQNMADEIMNWLRGENIYPSGKRGKAKYSDAQKSAFQAVMAAVRAGQMIVAGSKGHMKRGDDNRNGSSGGENVHHGLAGPHGYEVINFSMQADLVNVNDPAPDTICWIQLRNPWGKTGRVYKDVHNNTDMTQNDHAPVVGKMEDRETEDAEFWIPLEDFTKRFDVLTTL